MSEAYVCAVRLLTRREHGSYELAHKLALKGYSSTDIQEALHECQRLGLQCDVRFVENVCRTRIRQGYGPQRIRQELQHLRIDDEWINAALQKEHDHWLAYAVDVWKKKYKESGGLSYMDRQKQKQFLRYRGFSTDTIAHLFKNDE
jgi:regulatory protein